jgi:hypothetical protein
MINNILVTWTEIVLDQSVGIVLLGYVRDRNAFVGSISWGSGTKQMIY